LAIDKSRCDAAAPGAGASVPKDRVGAWGETAGGWDVGWYEAKWHASARFGGTGKPARRGACCICAGEPGSPDLDVRVDHVFNSRRGGHAPGVITDIVCTADSVRRDRDRPSTPESLGARPGDRTRGYGLWSIPSHERHPMLPAEPAAPVLKAG
jgi:hypothetical protein